MCLYAYAAYLKVALQFFFYIKKFNIPVSFNEIKNQEMNELAVFLEKHCDIDKILQF